MSKQNKLYIDVIIIKVLHVVHDHAIELAQTSIPRSYVATIYNKARIQENGTNVCHACRSFPTLKVFVCLIGNSFHS